MQLETAKCLELTQPYCYMVILEKGQFRKTRLKTLKTLFSENLFLAAFSNIAKKTRLPNKKLQSAIHVFVLTTEPITFH